MAFLLPLKFYKRQGGCFKWISDYWEIFKDYILKCNGFYQFLSSKIFKKQASLRLKCRMLKVLDMEAATNPNNTMRYVHNTFEQKLNAVNNLDNY